MSHSLTSSRDLLLFADTFPIANESVRFSCRAELLVHRLGRSSKPSPRYLILVSRKSISSGKAGHPWLTWLRHQTDKAVYLLISQAVHDHVQTTLERKIPLVTIRSVGLSNLQDDWMALNTTSGEEGDPLISCVLKTEFLVHLQQCTNGGMQINIGPTVSYAKKKGKMSTITFRKDDSIPRGDVYKSSTVSVPSGMPPNSVSAAPVPRKSKPKKAPKQSAVVRSVRKLSRETSPY